MAQDQDVQSEDFNGDTQPAPIAAEVTVTAPGVSITRPVDEATMAGVIALLFGSTPTVPSRVDEGGGVRQERAKSTGRNQESMQWEEDPTLGEFLTVTEAKTFPQKICAAGYYLIHRQGAESFSRDDIRTALVSAHEDMPGNFARDWSHAASASLIAAKPGDAGQYYVPKTGRTAVESSFQELGKRRPNRRTAKKATSSTKEDGE